MGGYEIMIASFSIGVILAAGFVFVAFAFIKYVLWQEKNDCLHETKTTYESYHKQVCVDCLEEFSTMGD